MKSRIHPPISVNVRTKILIIFLTLSLICLLVTGFAAFYTISGMGSAAKESSTRLGADAVRDSTAALQAATEEYLIRVATGQAELIDEIFWSSEAELAILADHARSVQNNPAYVSQIRSYPPASPPPDPLMGTIVELAPGAVVTETDPEYRALAGMDDLLASVYRTDGDLASVYVVSESGILRAYPWEQSAGPDFDFRKRAWFREAELSDGPVWTEPYVDASGNGLILTCAQAVSTRYGTWVVASDVTIDQLNQYTNLTLNGKGYSVLIDSKGTVLSRPGLSSGTNRWDQPFFEENALMSTDPDLVALGYNMTSGRTGLGRVEFNGVDTIITATNETGAQIERYTGIILYIFAGLCILLFVIVIILSWYLARIITRPVDALREGTSVIGKGDLDFRLDIRSGDEFEELADSFNQMAVDLKKNIEDLRRTTAEKERYTKELEIAKEIQNSFLPESVPSGNGFAVAAATIPAMEIGGDLYDFIPAGKGRWGFVIADVSGKGVSAALYMALSRTILHACGSEEPDPGSVICTSNRLIYGDGRSSMFITVFYGMLDPESMTFTYVNAGHNPPLFLRDGEAGIWMTGQKGIALGVVPDVRIEPSLKRLRSGDLLVLYTDGVTEAFNERDEEFGEDRLLDCVSRNRSRSVQEISDTLIEEIRTFSGTAPQSDDITLVVIRMK